ncbi:uncharacterized protein LOC141610842 [Silene latifolia]|uniref:uncharacterized protein LOC141610842 n=1 Tax=Silene latifolia TaxID=37657 RepID=UPI003D780C4F
MPYAKRRSREDFIAGNSGNITSKTGINLMPPEPLPPWDRKHGYKHNYDHHNHHHHYNNIGGGGGGSGGGGGGRWRDSPSSPFAAGSRSSSDFSPRWGFPSSEFRRPPGHSKQGGWHLYEEDSPHGYSTPRSGDRFMDDDCMRPSGPRGDGRYGRFYRDNRNGFGQKDWRGHSWEKNHQYSGPVNTPGRPHSTNSQKSVAESPARPSHPNTESRAQLESKDQADGTSDANGPGLNEKIGKENTSGSLDWKPLKWSRSGSLTSRGSGFSHSSSSKSTAGESSDAMGDLASKNVTPVQSPPGDVAGSAPSAILPEDASSRKKPRLGWGEGLAKYEKKKVDPEENINKIENTASAGNAEPTHSVNSTLAVKSPKITGSSDCSSPATPSSFACSSSPGLEKTYGKTNDGDSINFSVSSIPVSENQPEQQFSLEKLELNSITNLSSLLSQLLQVDDQCSMDSGFMRSSAFNKLLLWKGDISKVLELTEAEIDSLENELKSLKCDSGHGASCPGLSNLLPIDEKEGHFDGLNGFTRPPPLEVVLSEGMIVDNKLSSHYARGAHSKNKDEETDSLGTATSKLVEPLSSRNPVPPCELRKFCSADNGLVESPKTMPDNLFTCDNEEIIEETSSKSYNAKAITDDSTTAVVDHPGACNKEEDHICDIILSSNKDTAAKASEALIKLLHGDNNVNVSEAIRHSCLPSDTTIKEKFSRRKRCLKFKERVISLKYRAFHHLWKEDLRLLSLMGHRTKPPKKLDMTSRTMHNGSQKHRSSIRSRFSSPAGSSSLVPTTEILNLTTKLLSDSEVKIYRSGLKMPSMILDDKEKMSSRFVSSNGLVEDPCAVEKERALTNPWTIEEKEIFMEKLSTFGKDFRKIASFLDHKTIADCVQFYYKNHKSESFVKTKKPDAKKQSKPLSSDTYMLTSGKKWGREMNSASLHVLGAASVMAAQADQAANKTPKLSNRKARGSDGVVEDERETMAADVLAGICGSLSSEAMSSCITSSVDPTDGNYEWKHQKVGSSVKRPLTPHSVDDDDGDDTCSDESCGEMDPADWTDDEKSLFVRAFSSHGKDFLMISRFVGSKSRDQCKVFFSKARKCLGLETLHPGSNDTNGGGSDVEDACVVETGSVGCSGQSGSRMDEDLPTHVSPDVSKPDSTAGDLSTSDRNCDAVPGLLDCKDTDMEPEVLCPGDYSADGLDGVVQDDISKASATVDSVTEISPHISSVVNQESIFGVTSGKSIFTCPDAEPCASNSLVNHSGSRDGLCKQTTSQGESEVQKDSPLELSIKPEMKGDLTHKPGSESKIQSFQECYFRKCSRIPSQNAVAELPLLSKSVTSSSDTEKPCSSGDVKLFGKILSKPSSVEKATPSVQWHDETTNHHLTPGPKHDRNGFVGLENVPVRNYGIWDGSKIKVVSYPPSTNSSSALLLAKYPAAFAKGSVSAPNTDQQISLQVPVNSGECNLNNACPFSPREYNGGNLSVIDYSGFRNQDGGSPFILDFKQRQNVLPCTGISDPVVALRSHYSSQQYGSGGQSSVNGVVVREESWGCQGDVGR